MARVSIYVPDELRERMDKAGDAINWSEIARPHFLTALANLEHQKGQDMETVIERLRASKAASAANARQMGEKAGRQWASSRAEFGQLKALSTIENPEDLDEDDAFIVLHGTLNPNEEMTDDEFLEDVFGERMPPADFIVGFIIGAQKLFEEVEDRI